jgi:hypothetical protein
MLDSVWRIGQKSFDVDTFVAKFSIENISQLYREGEQGRRGKVNETSGLCMLISENMNADENIREIESFVLKNAQTFIYLKNLGIGNSIDIGCSLEFDQFTKSISLPASFLGLLSKYSIKLVFSLYPASSQEPEA